MKFWEAMKALEDGKKVRKVKDLKEKYYQLKKKGVCGDRNNQMIYTCMGNVLDCEIEGEWEIYEEHANVDFIDESFL